MLRWARERASHSIKDLSKKFPKLKSWEQGEDSPTLKQLEDFAHTVHVPVGYLFLPEPPEEQMPIADFRRIDSNRPSRYSPDLLDTIYDQQERQSCFRDYLLSQGELPRSFIGSTKISAKVGKVAADIAKTIKFSRDDRHRLKSWEDALHAFTEQVNSAGILVMVNGIVGNNTHRKLDPQEFRGFALSDPLAPLIFINGADTKAAQMFTLAHELAHLWLGETAVSDTDASATSHEQDTEVWCNKVAAELLAPLRLVKQNYNKNAAFSKETERLAHYFKVSKLVILRRLYDANELTSSKFHSEYKKMLNILIRSASTRKGGGDFHRSLKKRVNERFAQALIISTLEGKTLYRDCFRMLSIKKTATFKSFAKELGIELR